LIFLFYILSFYFFYFYFTFSPQLTNRRVLATVPERRRRRRCRHLCLRSRTPAPAAPPNLCLRFLDPDDAGRRSRGRATASEFFRKP
jgi:hypothetical protein